MDSAGWYLKPGDYELHMYAREDGTALDAIYVAGPVSPAPDPSKSYTAGDSTLCSKSSSTNEHNTKKQGRGELVALLFILLVGLAAVGLFLLYKRKKLFRLHKPFIQRGFGVDNEDGLLYDKHETEMIDDI